jgi:iron(III) transport system permease protein
MADFSTPLIVGGRFSTLASASYSQMIGAYNPGMASTLNAVMLVFSMAAFWLYTKFQASDNEARIEPGVAVQKPLVLNPVLRTFMMLISLLFAVGVLALLGSVLMAAFTKHLGANNIITLEHFRTIGMRGAGAMLRTVFLAGGTSILVALGGMGLAYTLTRSAVPGKKLIDFIATLPFAVPGTFMGIGFAMAFSHPPLILSGTWLIILASTVIRTLPVGLRSAISLLGRQDRSIEEASVSLGASRFGTFWCVVVPSMRPALVAGSIYTFISTVQTVGAIIFLVSTDKKLLSVEVFESVSNIYIGQSAALSTIMLTIAGAGGVLIFIMGQKEGAISWLRRSLTANV